jgi:hypothetical protein
MGLIARVDGSNNQKALEPDGGALQTGTDSEKNHLIASASEILNDSDSLPEQLTKEAVAKIMHGFHANHGMEIKETSPPHALIEKCASVNPKEPKFFQSTSDAHEVHAGYFPINTGNKDHVFSISVIVAKGTALSNFDFLGLMSSTDFSFIPRDNPVKPEIWKADKEEHVNEPISDTITPSYIENWLAAHGKVIGVLWFDCQSPNEAQVIFATPASASSGTADLPPRP